jgi:hypothetical protein
VCAAALDVFVAVAAVMSPKSGESVMIDWGNANRVNVVRGLDLGEETVSPNALEAHVGLPAVVAPTVVG